MSSFLTSATLIESITRRAHIPISQNTFTEDDLLAFANEELNIGIVPSMLKVHEEFFVNTVNLPLVSYQSSYDIPNRCIGEKIRNLFYVDNSDNYQEMARILPEDLVYYQNRSTVNYPRTFYIKSGEIILVPDITLTPQGSLVVSYFQRPNQLVDASRIATIQSIDFVGGVIQVDMVPSVFSLSANCDFLETDRGHSCRAIDIMPIGINSTLKTVTFTPTTIPTDLLVGDMIALAGECQIPQIPDDLHSILAQRVACRCLEAQKDTEGLQMANAKLQEMETNTAILIDNRTEGQPQKVNNLRGSLRMGKFRRRRGTY